jgi:DNA-binding MarR family transcriptional regulator
MTAHVQPEETAAAYGVAGDLVYSDLAPGPGEIALLQQWHNLHSGVKRLNSHLLAAVQAESGLAPSSFQALMFLITAPGQAAPMNQLAQALDFSTAGTTKVVDRLTEAGLVERRPSGSDRRVTYTALTTAGAERILAASRTLAQVLQARVVEPLGEELFGSVTQAITRIDPSPGPC